MTGLREHRERVRPEWIDYNGHLSEAYYVLVFGFATDAVMDQVGLDAAYRTGTGCSLYTVEAHVRYLREVKADAELVVTSRIVGTGAKKVRICHEMAVDGTVVATEEIMALHVDGAQGGTTPFPAAIAERFAALAEQPPEYAGRSID
ncbi:acyl-CoA thioester hydrolase [Saccharopolyspora shandongensis]|uniref:Acyl-CoA thioester hydrolase n=1 Tax=Saccharopolyspora shandongensis TaxID=418495 RepID=A0A1H3LVI9_9PSEU|nr:thioesterase family protein [Saccharopolyspora shandongensis]SDY68018.1 acyl-CoA thioester hydrolase [Saccharopolyspora shandongensis]